MNAVRVSTFFSHPLLDFQLFICSSALSVFLLEIYGGSFKFDFQEKYGIEPTMVVHGVKMLYVPVMPGHSKRLKLT